MKVGSWPTKLLDSAKLYGAKWKSEDAVSVIALWMLFSKQGGCREQGINFPLHTLDL